MTSAVSAGVLVAQLGQQGGRVLRRPGQRLRSQLGPAAQAGSKAGTFGLRGVGKEATVLASRCLHAADRAAIDAGGGHANEKRAVKTRIVRSHGAVAGVGVEGGGGRGHGRNDRFRRRENSPFSDMVIWGGCPINSPTRRTRRSREGREKDKLKTVCLWRPSRILCVLRVRFLVFDCSFNPPRAPAADTGETPALHATAAASGAAR